MELRQQNIIESVSPIETPAGTAILILETQISITQSIPAFFDDIELRLKFEKTDHGAIGKEKRLDILETRLKRLYFSSQTFFADVNELLAATITYSMTDQTESLENLKIILNDPEIGYLKRTAELRESIKKLIDIIPSEDTFNTSYYYEGTTMGHSNVKLSYNQSVDFDADCADMKIVIQLLNERLPEIKSNALTEVERKMQLNILQRRMSPFIHAFERWAKFPNATTKAIGTSFLKEIGDLEIFKY